MNESKTEPQRYWLALMLDDLPPGTEFEPGRLHITIIPWFVSEEAEAEIINSFESRFSNQSKFRIFVGQRALFGPKHNVAVNLVEPREDLATLHHLALLWFEQIGARWAVKKPHVDQEYIPHMRRRQGTKFRTGDEIQVSSISLIKAARAEDNKRMVAAEVELQ